MNPRRRRGPEAAPRIRVLIPASRIRERVRALARRIDRDCAGQRDVVLVGVLKGAFVFMSDLCRHLETPIRCDFVRASSYGDARESSGAVRIELDLTQPVAGAHVILVEDILDTGLTARRLMETLRAKRPARIRLCTLLWKRSRTRHAVRPDYVGFRIPDRFVVGYGLDLVGRCRNLPYVGVVE
jgi:hypoxanthine phosphoribosyltransferase